MAPGLRGILLASAVFSAACKDILVGGHHFVPADGGAGAGGSDVGGSDVGGSGGAEPQACRNGLTACGEDCIALSTRILPIAAPAITTASVRRECPALRPRG